MRIVVADATPLHYLILIGAIGILPRIFEKIHVPIEVRDELTCEGTPPEVRTWMQRPPHWLEILVAKLPTSEDSALQALDPGERAAILLAESLHADLLLIDDRAGAALARRRGLAVTGTLGLLDLASQMGCLICATPSRACRKPTSVILRPSWKRYWKRRDSIGKRKSKGKNNWPAEPHLSFCPVVLVNHSGTLCHDRCATFPANSFPAPTQICLPNQAPTHGFSFHQLPFSVPYRHAS